jgi:hypothetical protein
MTGERKDETVERNRSLRTVLPVAALGVLILVAVIGFVMLSGGGDSTDGTPADEARAAGAADAAPATQSASPQAAAPVAASAQPAATAPSGATPQQLQAANLNAADAAMLYGSCAHEFITQNDSNVQQAVSSSAALMQAMGAAGYSGVRSASRTPTPCQGLPYSVSTVMGNAGSGSNAEALFDAAVLNYGQVLYTNVVTFAMATSWDESYCQSGVYPPAGNIIGVACWVRDGTFVGGSFVLLPPNSQQPVITRAANDSNAYWQRVRALIP